MTAVTDAPEYSVEPAQRYRIGIIDWLMLVLALISVGLLCYETWWDVTEPVRAAIITADYTICAIFFVEFMWRWRKEGWKRQFVGRNWYEVLGMIPLQHPALRGFRLFRVIRIIILFSRFGIAADRAFGQEFTYNLVNKVTNKVVDKIKRPVTVAVLDEVCNVLYQGHYTKNIARALEENQFKVREMVVEKLRDDPTTGRLSRLPFYNDIVASVSDATLRVAHEILDDPRTDELVADILRENIQQIRESVRNNKKVSNSSNT